MLLSVFVLSDFHVCLSVTSLFLCCKYDFNNINNNYYRYYNYRSVALNLVFALVITDDFRYAKETFAVCPLRFRSPVRIVLLPRDAI